MSTKLRRTKSSTGRPGKAIRRLNGRIADWENTSQNAKGKDSKAYKRPGAMKQ